MRARVTILDFPGGDLVAAGLADAAAGIESAAALVVAVGAPRLRRLGYDAPPDVPDPERRLYDLLAREDADAAHGRYNALVRRLVSFENAAESLGAPALR